MSHETTALVYRVMGRATAILDAMQALKIDTAELHDGIPTNLRNAGTILSTLRCYQASARECLDMLEAGGVIARCPTCGEVIGSVEERCATCALRANALGLNHAGQFVRVDE